MQVPPLEFRRVKTVQIIKCPYRMAGLQQMLANVRPNKSCSTGNEKIHDCDQAHQPKNTPKCQAQLSGQRLCCARIQQQVGIAKEAPSGHIAASLGSGSSNQKPGKIVMSTIQ